MRTIAVLAFVALTSVAGAGSAEAMPIWFETTGVFSSPTGACTSAVANTIICGSFFLSFTGGSVVQDVPIGSPSVVDFGRLTLFGDDLLEHIGGGSFSLNILQLVPASTAGTSPFSFAATLFAEVHATMSGSYVEFTGLQHTVTGGFVDLVFDLTEADDGVPGRSRIAAYAYPQLDIFGTVTPVLRSSHLRQFRSRRL